MIPLGLSRRANGRCAGEVAPIAVHACGDIGPHHVTTLHRPRSRRSHTPEVAACSGYDCRARPVGAMGAKCHCEQIGDLDLGHARPDRAEGLWHGLVRNCKSAAECVLLEGCLDQSQTPQYIGRVVPLVGRHGIA